MGAGASKKGEKKLFRLTYKSILNASDEMPANQIIEDVLKVAEVFNPSKEIGGILYCNTIDGSNDLIQVLEGSRTEVKKLYSRIRKDKRHREVTVLLEEKVSEQRYPTWGMLKAREEDWKVIKTYLPSQEEWREMKG